MTAITKTCDNCGNDYQATREDQRWCSRECRKQGHRRERATSSAASSGRSGRGEPIGPVNFTEPADTADMEEWASEDASTLPDAETAGQDGASTASTGPANVSDADPKEIILALVRLAEDEEERAQEDSARQFTDADRARFRRIIENLLKHAFDPAATDAERQSYMNRAAALAAEYGVRWEDLAGGSGGDGSSHAAPPGHGAEDLFPSPADPLAVARELVGDWTGADGSLTLRRWSGRWVRWDGSRWRDAEEAALHGHLYRRLERAVYVEGLGLEPWRPTEGKIRAILHALGKALALVDRDIAPPAWLDEQGGPDPRGIVSVANGLLDVTSGKLEAATPVFFNVTAVPFPYRADAPEPVRWHQFLTDLWGDDEDSKRLLQQWFGYVLRGAPTCIKSSACSGRHGRARGPSRGC